MRGVATVLVLLVLVVVAVVGVGALLARFMGPTELAVRERCRAEVPVPGGDGDVYAASFAPDQTATAALVVGVANRRGLPARAGTIGVATAVQESSLRNIDYGDRDSLGLFQQRPSQGWGSAEQVQDPLYATGAFYDALVEVDGWQDREVTDAAQRVQRSAFPEAYGDHEPEGRALASSFYGLSQASLWCELGPVEDPPDDPAAEVERLVAALEVAGPAGWAVTSEPAEHAEGVLRLTVEPAAEPDRARWAVAHTVVALAAAHDVTAVEADGRRWTRESGAAGWAEAGEPGGAGVTVRLATPQAG
ncbi:hypothetical protein [Aquipuribacter sp. SD81]|uniref:hypothetical protein n=1 Tax=Aquipuribacter sp. SD81 TaxID=3127703 RepID=UPI00301AA334